MVRTSTLNIFKEMWERRQKYAKWTISCIYKAGDNGRKKRREFTEIDWI